jgi:uncharacterized protein (TIGR03083 family)
MLSKDRITQALADEWAGLASLLTALDEGQWAAPTPCPGWTVRDATAHIIGTELSLLGRQPAETDEDVRALPHVRNDIGAMNEAWVRSLRSDSPGQLVERLRAVTGERLAALRALSEDEFQAPSWTPAGQGTYARFMQIRLFDCWMHEQDIRDAAGQPGGQSGPGAELSVDEISLALGYLVGKRGKAPDGSSVSFELTGPLSRTLNVRVDGRAAVVEQLPGPATVVIRLPLGVFTRLCGGRVTPGSVAGQLTLIGDQDLGRQLIGALAYTI